MTKPNGLEMLMVLPPLIKIFLSVVDVLTFDEFRAAPVKTPEEAEENSNSSP